MLPLFPSPLSFFEPKVSNSYNEGIEKDIIIKGLELKFSDLEAKIKKKEEEILSLKNENEELLNVFHPLSRIMRPIGLPS